MTCQESIWLPRSPGISSCVRAPLKCEKGENVKVPTPAVLRFAAESCDEMCETSPCVCLFAATPPSTPCSPSSPWCWTKTSSRKSPCCTLNCTKISSRYLATSGVFYSRGAYRNENQVSDVSPPQGRPLSFKTFLIWVLISIYQGKTQFVQE